MPLKKMYSLENRLAVLRIYSFQRLRESAFIFNQRLTRVIEKGRKLVFRLNRAEEKNRLCVLGVIVTLIRDYSRANKTIYFAQSYRRLFSAPRTTNCFRISIEITRIICLRSSNIYDRTISTSST